MIRRFAILLIRLYQLVVSPLLGPCCRFSPSCSAYAATCISRFGVLKGTALATKRLLKCHPLGSSGYDPPPQIKDPSPYPTMRKV